MILELFQNQSSQYSKLYGNLYTTCMSLHLTDAPRLEKQN